MYSKNENPINVKPIIFNKFPINPKYPKVPTIDFFSVILCLSMTAKSGAITPTKIFNIPVNDFFTLDEDDQTVNCNYIIFF